MDSNESFVGSGSKPGDYAKRLDNLNKKKSTFLTPLNCGSGSKVGDYAKRLDNLNKKKSTFLGSGVKVGD